MSPVLLVFAKVPRPGDVKTRLTPVLSPEAAAHLYDAFLRDALALYSELAVDVRLYLAPPFPDGGIEGMPTQMSVHEQQGDGLGPRMQHAFHEAFRAGYERAVIVGTDHPTLPPAFIQRALNALKTPGTITIGPSEDGGFYLLGMNDFYPHLFERMTYSHDEVFADTRARAEATEAQVLVLPEWYDVDTPSALRRLLDDLDDADVQVPRTRTAVRELSLRTQLSLDD